MSFMRPEARAEILRWSEPALSGAVFAVMLWVGGLMLWRGSFLGGFILAVAVGAGFWFRTAFMRARLGHAALGPGVVMVDERRITYMGPAHGGVLALDSLAAIEVMISGNGVYEPAPAWVLHHPDGPPLVVPAGADGADALLETFAALPGFSYDRAVAAMSARPGTRARVWRREAGSPVSALATRAGSD